MLRSAFPMLLSVSALLFSCEGKELTSAAPSGSSAAETEDEPSPNAKILPEPLKEGASAKRGTGGQTGAPSTTAPAPPLPRPAPEPFRPDRQLDEDEPIRGFGAGYRAVAQLRWPTVKGTTRFPEGERVLWPTMEIEFLKESAVSIARMRWVLRSETFPFPSGSELRFRADRLGAVVLWPDQRSYRAIPEGALRSLFLDRRVDRVPFVEAEVKDGGKGTRLDQPVTVISVRSSVATSELFLGEVRDLPYAGPLLCHALLEWVRVKATDEMCPSGTVPLAFRVVWSNGEELVFELTELISALDLSLEKFRTPPDLPIFKPGELPPRENEFFSAADTQVVFPVTKKKGPLVFDPALLPASAAPPLPGAPPAPAPSKRPQNEIVLENALDRPLVVFLGRLPFARLAPQETTTVYLQRESITVSAHDFFRERVVPELEVTGPKTVRLGAPGGAPSAAP